MKFRKLTAMLLSVTMVAGLAATCAFADDPPAGDMAGGGGDMGGGSAGFTLPTNQLSVWIKDGIVVQPNTDGATEYKVDRIVTGSSDLIGSFSQGGSTEADDDYAYITAIYIKDGKLVEEKSVSEAISDGAENVTDTSASDITIVSEYEGFNPIIVVDSNYTITGADITITTDGDGSKTCDFSGLGAAIAAYGDETLLVIEDSNIEVSGVANLTVFADNGANVIIKNSTLSSDGGTLYKGYLNSPDQSTMVAPPWILGIMGTSRCTNLMGNNSTTTVIDSDVSAAQWAILSTDSGSNMKLNVVNTDMSLTGADYVLQNDTTFGTENGSESNPYTDHAGYGTYAIGDADEYFYGVDMSVGTYATIFTGGKGTYTALKAGKEITLYDANGGVVTTYTPTEDKVTTIDSDTFGFMIHQSSNEITIEEGTVVNSGYTTFLMKTGCSAVTNVTSGAELNPDNGILIQAMDNDDTTTGMNVGAGGLNPGAFYTTHKENAGWPTTASTAKATNTGVFNFADVELEGDIYNATGYASNDQGAQPATAISVNLSGSTTLTGAISSTSAIHVTKEGSDAVAAADAGEKASEDWLKYQLTSFDISEYYNIGQVANKVYYNGVNDINVTITDNAAWDVTASGIVNNLTAKSAAITADEPVTITVKGTLTLDGKQVTETTTVGNVTYVVETDLTAQYTDLSSTAWYATEINYILSNGLMNGTSATTFEPNSTLTREMLATIIWRAAGSPDAAGSLTFADADSISSWAKTAVAWAAEQGIVNGVGNNKFDPATAVSRQDMAVMIARWAKGEAAEDASLSQFTDAAKVSPYATDALKWAVAQGLFKGDNGKLNPTNSITRIEAAAVLARYLMASN